ncbi:Uncharacterised protein [marine metagenome]
MNIKMQILLPIHILVGIFALLSSAFAVCSEKGKRIHVLSGRNIDDDFNVGDRMSNLKDLLSRMGKSDEIKSYFNKINDSLVLIKRCVFVLVFLAVLMVIISALL